MTVITDSYTWSDLVDPYTPGQEQPHGYDFSVGKIEYMRGIGTLQVKGKTLPEYREVKPTGSGFIYLQPGVYIVTFREQVSIPLNAMGYMRPRSSLIRMGATLETAVWDAGYSGVSSTLLVVHNPNGIRVEKNAPIGQMILHTTESTTRGYDGQYQHEGIEERGLAKVFVGSRGNEPAREYADLLDQLPTVEEAQPKGY